jgi:acyl-CoA thioester hydrolase
MTELWRELGGYVAMREEGVDMVVAQAELHYYAALGFDDEADLIVRRIKLGNTSMTSDLAIERNGEAVAEGELRHVFVDLAAGKTRPIPDPIRQGLERYT